jgi:hypothetical protein
MKQKPQEMYPVMVDMEPHVIHAVEVEAERLGVTVEEMVARIVRGYAGANERKENTCLA